MRSILQRSKEGDWEIMLCHINQYALSKPKRTGAPEEKNGDWYAKYLSALANQAKRISGLRPQWSLNAWKKLRTRVIKDPLLGD